MRHAVAVSQPHIKKDVLSNLVQMRLQAAWVAAPGSLDVRPSLDDDYDVEVSISPFDSDIAAKIAALVPEARLVIREGGTWTRGAIR